METIDRTLHFVARCLAAISCLILVGIVAVTVIDTSRRYVFNSPISGSNEIIETMLGIVIMLALPITTLDHAHIKVDLFETVLSRRIRRVLSFATTALALVTLGYLAQRAWKKASDAYEFGDATIYLGIPQAPIYAMISITVIVFLLTLVWVAIKPEPDDG